MRLDRRDSLREAVRLCSTFLAAPRISSGMTFLKAACAAALSPAAIAYGGLTVTIREEPKVSQPAPLGRGDTKVVPRSDVQVSEAPGELHTLAAAASVADVADALNALGAKPRERT